MSFQVAGAHYDRFIGRYSKLIAPRFAAFAGVERGERVLEVGCGTGLLAAELAERVGADHVSAVDASEPFVAAARARVPGADIRYESVERMPWVDGAFDRVLSQLVLSILPDVPAAMTEMRRVTRGGGTIAACTFDAEGFELARMFWEVALVLDPKAPDDAALPLRRMPELVALWQAHGLTDVETETLRVTATYASFDDLWEPFAFGIGPTGTYLVKQDHRRRAMLREGYRQRLGAPAGSFELSARVLCVRGRV